jgi:biopolymer transport protein ExbD
LAVIVAASATTFNPAIAADKRPDAVSEVLARQKKIGDELNVYLKNATGIYVNGKQISLKTLATVVRKSRTKRAVISAERDVPRERVNQVKEVIQKGGLKDIKLTTPKQRTDEKSKDKTRQRKNK